MDKAAPKGPIYKGMQLATLRAAFFCDTTRRHPYIQRRIGGTQHTTFKGRKSPKKETNMIT
jgi:hypothetical protein